MTAATSGSLLAGRTLLRGRPTDGGSRFSSGPKIYVVNAAGGEPQALANRYNNKRRSSLSWSPDGRKLSFLEAGACGEYCLNLLVMDAEWSGRARNVTCKS